MEEHAWASYTANRKLLNKRSFRNLGKDLHYSIQRTKKTRNVLVEQKLKKIGQKTQKRTWLTVGLLLFGSIGLITWWLLQHFL